MIGYAITARRACGWSVCSCRKPEAGVRYLVAGQFVDDRPSSVARFLLTRKGLSKQMIGDYLGNLQRAFNMEVLRYSPRPRICRTFCPPPSPGTCRGSGLVGSDFWRCPHSMPSMSVRRSGVCTPVRPSVCLSHRSTAAAAAGVFAAERTARRRWLRAPCWRRAGAQQQMRVASR